MSGGKSGFPLHEKSGGGGGRKRGSSSFNTGHLGVLAMLETGGGGV